MGITCRVSIAAVRLPKSQISAAHEAVRSIMDQTDLMTGGGWENGQRSKAWFLWVSTERVLAAQTFIDLAAAWRWQFTETETGDLALQGFLGEKLGDDMAFWEALTPFVEGAIFMWLDETDTVFLQFKDGKAVAEFGDGRREPLAHIQEMVRKMFSRIIQETMQNGVCWVGSPSS